MRLFAAQATARPAITRKALHWLLRILVGSLILATGAGKALDVPGFAEVIRRYRLGWADDFLLPIGFGITGLELALAGLSYLLLRGARMCSRGSAQGDPQAMGLMKSLLMGAFGRPAGPLGRLGGTIMARTNRRIARRAIQLLDVRPGDRVLEVGFGPGVGIELLASATPSGWAAGIDPSEEMLKQARMRNANAVRTGRVELLRGSVEGLPFENSAFNKAVAINSMQVWPDVITGLREIQRVLKPGGRLVLGFARYLEMAGFEDIKVERKMMKPVSTVGVLGRNLQPDHQ